jgi:short-subunit dehydrogenase
VLFCSVNTSTFPYGFFLDGSSEDLKKMLDLNVLGLSLCTKEALQSMKERGVDDGHIIHINRLVILTYVKEWPS